MKMKHGSMPTGQFETHVPIGEVQESLNRALDGHRLQIAEFDSEIQTLKIQRIGKIRTWVKAHVGNLNPDTLNFLSNALPEMKSQFDECRHFHKTLGFIEGYDYKEALKHLKLLVTARLDAGHTPELEVDTLFSQELVDIASTETLRTNALKNQAQVEETLKNLDKASRHGVKSIPRSALPQHHLWTPSPAIRQTAIGQSSISDNSDMDLWMYYLTDIPTSGRTLLIDVLESEWNHASNPTPDFSGQGGSFAGGGASGVWDAITPGAGNQSVDASANPGMAATLMTGGVIGGDAYQTGQDPAFDTRLDTHVDVEDLHPDRPIDPDPLPSFDDSLSQSIDDESGKYS